MEEAQYQQWKTQVLKNLVLKQRERTDEACFEHAAYTAKESYLTLLGRIRYSCLQELERYIQYTREDTLLSDTTKTIFEISMLDVIDKLEQKHHEFKELQSRVAELTSRTYGDYSIKKDVYDEYEREYLSTGVTLRDIQIPVFTVLENEEHIAKSIVAFGIFSHTMINKFPEPTEDRSENRNGVWKYADDTVTLFSIIVDNLAYRRYIRPQASLDSNTIFYEYCTLTLSSPRHHLPNVTILLPLSYTATNTIRNNIDIVLSYMKKMHTLYQIASGGNDPTALAEHILPQLQEVVTLFPF